jgi:hypothetical protein
MPRLDAAPVILQPNVHMGPATVLLEDLADASSYLREQTTTSSKKGWSEQTYDFPNSYVDIPQRVMSWDPISTYADDQNNRFVQRYMGKK